jgi:hypothetical protein
MHPLICLVAVMSILVFAAPAMADDKAECESGVQTIKSELAKKHPKQILDRLSKALDRAEQEAAEGDWDECVDAVKDARKSLQ